MVTNHAASNHGQEWAVADSALVQTADWHQGPPGIAKARTIFAQDISPTVINGQGNVLD